MANHGALELNNDLRSEPERAVVQTAVARIAQTVVLLSRNCPPEILPKAAYEDLLILKPHLEEALEALEDIKNRRSLIDEELSQEYAFKMLLACRR